MNILRLTLIFGVCYLQASANDIDKNWPSAKKQKYLIDLCFREDFADCEDSAYFCKEHKTAFFKQCKIVYEAIHTEFSQDMIKSLAREITLATLQTADKSEIKDFLKESDDSDADDQDILIDNIKIFKALADIREIMEAPQTSDKDFEDLYTKILNKRKFYYDNGSSRIPRLQPQLKAFIECNRWSSEQCDEFNDAYVAGIEEVRKSLS